ncbi:hypothetical protein [Candidatus Hamiltonella defensa]|uniref:hypothetical protein n=1 Tax=Candidatus Williamhamiltonella defendens TaxID=138072 RepID=UPI0020C721E2|nr:hypothetical protein [Candidatus Hamiltonella defensa]
MLSFLSACERVQHLSRLSLPFPSRIIGIGLADDFDVSSDRSIACFSQANNDRIAVRPSDRFLS